MRKRDYSLQNEDLEQIVQAMKHDPRSEVVQRATALHLLHLGHDALEVAQKLAVCKASVHNWYRRWRAGGVEALANEARSGRPSKASAPYRAALEKALASHPSVFGYDFQIWTLERLVAHLEGETGIHLSVGRLEFWLDRWGYVYRRPKQVLTHKQDAQAKAAMAERLEGLKKAVVKELSNSSLWTKRA
jgi:transposase